MLRFDKKKITMELNGKIALNSDNFVIIKHITNI